MPLSSFFCRGTRIGQLVAGLNWKGQALYVLSKQLFVKCYARLMTTKVVTMCPSMFQGVRLVTIIGPTYSIRLPEAIRSTRNLVVRLGWLATIPMWCQRLWGHLLRYFGLGPLGFRILLSLTLICQWNRAPPLVSPLRATPGPRE